ncbi:hypothetical protein AB0F96_21530 [Streptomyces sp. NPDC023998]|uniref:hypothetical protein n=1 Tax=Streptomyces sp. NPDC023998 TaxID=3154597 RepID=UPI0033C22A97
MFHVSLEDGFFDAMNPVGERGGDPVHFGGLPRGTCGGDVVAPTRSVIVPGRCGIVHGRFGDATGTVGRHLDTEGAGVRAVEDHCLHRRPPGARMMLEQIEDRFVDGLPLHDSDTFAVEDGSTLVGDVYIEE